MKKTCMLLVVILVSVFFEGGSQKTYAYNLVDLEIDIPEVEISIPEIPEVDMTLPIYGNWCGPGHGGYTLNDPHPIDFLDYGCMLHDICYATKGYFNGNCDNDLLEYIESNKSSMSEKEKKMARLLYFTFYLSKF
ncbi:TPA: hypothetical protein RD687_002874, partial [Enterococcus faecalis]|nr:hypothetical protein [Enterococcus faecalis]